MNAYGVCLVFALTMLAGAAVQAQPARQVQEFQPEVGQDGKDVIWVPTSLALVNKMLDMAKVAPGDYLIDLGSGDGRTVITAAQRGIKALGIEYNPDMVELSRKAAAKAGVAEKAAFVKADLFETDFSQATVITMFLLPEINLQLRPKIMNLKPGTRIVSNTFTMGEWDADDTATAPGEESSYYYRKALLWIVPAKVEGAWKSADGDFKLKQAFQKVSGSMNANGVATLLAGGRLRGDLISFSAGGTRYNGKVEGDSIRGTATAGGASREWQAVRHK